MHLSGGNLKVTEKEHGGLEDVLDKYDFTVFGTSSSSSLTNQAEDRRQPAIKDAEKSLKWDAIEKHLCDAKAALERLNRDVQRFLPAVQKSRDPDLVGKFKEVHTQVQQSLQKVNDALLWKEPCLFSTVFNEYFLIHIEFFWLACIRSWKVSSALANHKWMLG